MLLRESSKELANEVDLIAATSDVAEESGVEHGFLIAKLVETLLKSSEEIFRKVREECVSTLGATLTTDVITVAAGFNGINRVADATGIPLDGKLEEFSVKYLGETRIGSFKSI